jgi:hypothetical protein
MARRIFIHAGQHKTGTTSIQHYIERHAETLTAQGIAPFRDWTPDLSGEARYPLPCNVKMIANALIRADLGTPMRLSGKARPIDDDTWDKRLAGLRAALRDVPAETVLLSAEAFAFLREVGERVRLDQLCEGFAMTAVMFLREPVAWRASWALQIGHAGYADTSDARAGTGIFDLSAGSWLVDHDAIRSFWRGDCRFLSYEDAMAAHGSIIPAFLLGLGLDPASCPPWDDVFLNTSTKKRQRSARPPA